MPKKNSKSRKKVTKRKKKTNQIDYKLIGGICAVIVVGIIIVIILAIRSKDVVCSGINEYDQGIKQLNEIIFNIKNNNTVGVNVTKTITIDDKYKSNNSSYLEIIDESLKESYKSKGISYKSEITDGKLIVYLTYDGNKKYILNDVDVILNDGGVSVNVMTEDNNNNRITIDLSKNNTKEDVRKLSTNKKYTCN